MKKQMTSNSKPARKIGLLIVAVLMFAHKAMQAQAVNDTAALFAEVRELQAVYQAPVSFDINYIYTSEQRPDSILDTMHGTLEMSGTSFRYCIDSVETMTNASYSVTLFKNEKIMYLSRPSGINTADPVQQFRSVLEKMGFSSCTVKQEKGRKVIQIGFPAGGPYREIEMDINKKTGYISAMRYVMKTMLLMESGATEADAAAYGEYAIVTTTFDHYKPLSTDYIRFNEGSYFYKDGAGFKPTNTYSEYKIFKGSPNL